MVIQYILPYVMPILLCHLEVFLWHSPERYLFKLILRFGLSIWQLQRIVCLTEYYEKKAVGEKFVKSRIRPFPTIGNLLVVYVLERH